MTAADTGRIDPTPEDLEIFQRFVRRMLADMRRHRTPRRDTVAIVKRATLDYLHFARPQP